MQNGRTILKWEGDPEAGLNSMLFYLDPGLSDRCFVALCPGRPVMDEAIGMIQREPPALRVFRRGTEESAYLIMEACVLMEACSAEAASAAYEVPIIVPMTQARKA